MHEPGREHLQRDGARQVPVDRAEDLAHAAAPDQALERVAGDLVARAELQFARHVGSLQRGHCTAVARNATPRTIAARRWRSAGGSLALTR